MRGHGLISSVGGKGNAMSGGGSGGRIAVHAGYSNDYLGKMEAFGSAGKNKTKCGMNTFCNKLIFWLTYNCYH